MKKIKKIAIANRGEVACRIHRTCKKLGIQTVLLHSDVDAETYAYRLCDETASLGGPTPAESYLNIDRVIAAALKSDADAIHPGFGFLSENHDFAQKVADAGMIFIGPDPITIQSFGDKKTAKDICEKAGVPTIPGYKGDDTDINQLVQECKNIGYPVIVKATAGGGGRGMRIISHHDEAKEQISLAKSEAEKAFGNSSVFLEKYMNNSKHIEVQIFGDHKGQIHVLGERECSVQRKHQKIIEETPSTSLSDEQRREVHSYAKKIGELAKYKNAGTVEFIFQDEQFYFLEVNTRLQVEHPVTEEVFGVDLVKAQILTADGLDLNWPKEFVPKGYSIELRLYAENPYKNGAPSIGKVGELSFPPGHGRRYEYGIETGDRVTPYYDSMVAKIISTKNTRIDAITDLVSILDDLKVFGFYTNRPLLKKILSHPDYILNKVTTQFFEKNFKNAMAPQLSDDQKLEIEQHLLKLGDIHSPLPDLNSPWAQQWRTEALYGRSNKLNSNLQSVDFKKVDDKIWWSYKEDTFDVSLRQSRTTASAQGDGKIVSPMPGNLFKILCTTGKKVNAGDTLVILEAMKMEHSIKAAKNGVIKQIYYKQGDNIQAEDLILEME